MIELEQTFQNATGITIFYREWLSAAAKHRRFAALAHRPAEQLGR